LTLAVVSKLDEFNCQAHRQSCAWKRLSGNLSETVHDRDVVTSVD